MGRLAEVERALEKACYESIVAAGASWSVRGERELLRHSNIQITMRYAHLAPDNVRNAVQRLEGVESRFSHSREGEL